MRLAAAGNGSIPLGQGRFDSCAFSLKYHFHNNLHFVKHKPLPSRQLLLQLLDYDSITGEFTWKVTTGNARAGAKAGRINSKGYECIKIGGSEYKAHRLAWMCVHGEDPGDYEIDHVNHCRFDNRIAFLRKATTRQNSQNNRGKGICWHKRQNKWQAQIRAHGKLHHLGLFDCPLMARLEYEKAAKFYFEEFANC